MEMDNTPTREEWERMKQEQHDEYWTWVNTEAENLVKDAEQNKEFGVIVQVPNNDRNILDRVQEITGNKINAYGQDTRRYYGLDFMRTHFFHSTYKNC